MIQWKKVSEIKHVLHTDQGLIVGTILRNANYETFETYYNYKFTGEYVTLDLAKLAIECEHYKKETNTV